MIDEKTKKSILDQYLKDGTAKKKLAEAMISPLLRSRSRFYSFYCEKCGLENKDRNYVHSDEECVISEVILK